MAADATNVTGTEGETASTDGTGADERLAVTVHLRSSPSTAVARRQRSVVDRLDDLEDAAQVPAPTVERWGSRVPVPATDGNAEAAAVTLYEELSAAAEEAGARLEPFFEQREVVNGLLSAGPASERVVVFPVVSLTVRRDGDLTGLYPCWQDGTHHSVEDALDALADGDTAENL